MHARSRAQPVLHPTAHSVPALLHSPPPASTCPHLPPPAFPPCPQDDYEVVGHVLDILGELVSRFGGLLGPEHGRIRDALLGALGEGRVALRKKALQGLGEGLGVDEGGQGFREGVRSEGKSGSRWSRQGSEGTFARSGVAAGEVLHACTTSQVVGGGRRACRRGEGVRTLLLLLGHRGRSAVPVEAVVPSARTAPAATAMRHPQPLFLTHQ